MTEVPIYWQKKHTEWALHIRLNLQPMQCSSRSKQMYHIPTESALQHSALAQRGDGIYKTFHQICPLLSDSSRMHIILLYSKKGITTQRKA